MPVKILLKALIAPKNLILLAVILFLHSITKVDSIVFIGLGLYLFSVGFLFVNNDFRTKCKIEDKIRNIRNLNYRATSAYLHLKTKVARGLANRIVDKIFKILGKVEQADIESRIDTIHNTKTEIWNAYLQKEYTPIREKIVHKSVELSLVYFRLIDIYFTRLPDVSEQNISMISERINGNARKKIIASNQIIEMDIERAIEADQKLLEKLREARKEVEKMGAKIILVESTMAMLKQQMFSEYENKQMFEEIENTINEVEAFGNALNFSSGIKKRARV